MVKIVYVITQLGVGGAENVLVSMANKMKSMGHDVYVISLLNMCNQKFDENIKISILDFKKTPILSFLKLCKLISLYKPDVVHSHCIHANIITRFVRFFSPIKKLITTAHSSNEGGKLIMYIFKYTNFLSNSITHVSKDAVLTFEKNDYIKFGIMKVMHNIINIGKFEFSPTQRKLYREKFNFQKNEYVLIAVGMMKDAKDYPNLINAIKYMKDNYARPFKLVIVGDGLLLSDLKKQAKDNKVDQNILFLGQRSDVSSLLSMSDFFILSSKVEGLPSVLIEAAMAKNCIITTNCSGVCDILPNLNNVVPIQNPIALAKMIIARMEEPYEVRMQKVEVIYDYVNETFNPDKIAQQWIRLYS